jgi:hypothetical protein
MLPFLRWFGAAALSYLATLGLMVPQAQAQFRRGFPIAPSVPPLVNTNLFPNHSPIFVPALGTPGVGVNPNPFITPFRTLQQSTFNTATTGNALATIPPYGLGYNPSAQYPNSGAAYPSPGAGGPYGSNGSGSYSPYGYGGYGSMLSGGYGSPQSGGSAGYGTNPYYGYLRGAADVTNANAQYQKTIQEARELRARARIGELDARRHRVDQVEYERGKQPTALMMKAQDEATALNEARNNPPLSSVVDGSALNTLLHEVRKQHNAGRRGPNMPLAEDVLKAVNLTPPDIRGNAGLLKDGGRPHWPAALQGSEFTEARKTIGRLIAHAVQEVTFNHPVGGETVNDLRAALKGISQTLHANVGEMSPAEYLAGRRYLTQLGQAATALTDPGVCGYFNNRGSRGKNVAELVRYMSDNGLVFAAAVPGDEAAYATLYQALSGFEARMQPAPK